jgi:hypothetical protein
MRLSDFQWSRNPRGLHIQRILITPVDFERWTRPRMGWVKLIASELEYVDDSQRFLELNITPVLRPYRGEWGARPMDAAMRDQIIAYANAGVKWFEFYNEPNLGVEWPNGFDPDWRDFDNVIRPLADNWLVFAEFVISLGGYPGFISLAESVHPRYASVAWTDALLNYYAEYRYQRFQNVLANGAYAATHPYILNHFYQEVAGGGPRSARPPEAQNAREGGWHFEYPYDPISQANDSGRTVYGGTALTPEGDPNGLLAMGIMMNERCADLFGTQAIPVLGTEGGIWPYRDGSRWQQDNRFPPYTEESQAHATVAMFEWIANEAPPWFFGLTLWKEDDYYFNGTNSPAINLLAATPPIFKSVPSIPVMGNGYVGFGAEPQEPEVAPGPGPIQGQADYHMIVLAPGLELDWFFETAQAYWNTFRPMVATRTSLIEIIPPDTSLATTVIARPDQIAMMISGIQERYRNVWFDLVIADSQDNVRQILNERVRINRRFG